MAVSKTWKGLGRNCKRPIKTGLISIVRIANIARAQVQHDGSCWRASSHLPFSRARRALFCGPSAPQFVGSDPDKTEASPGIGAGVLFRAETHGGMSHPRGTPGSPDPSIVRNTWPNLVFPDDDFACQHFYVLN
jgi:hypothetical protein